MIHLDFNKYFKNSLRKQTKYARARVCSYVIVTTCITVLTRGA